ncbi:uncharacterized protein LOC120698439 isoform X3 [Panicum virgatum]|uniref:uncharacterized protein LOC120698439 isoform X3 n=1 Tax=Panicum virgatum TaxID=38727 RepID=UPI0019D52668|nr:uncharacterized protein LOC120698439 isoform X3 [Panicum virgatum]
MRVGTAHALRAAGGARAPAAARTLSADRKGILPSFQHKRPLRVTWRHYDSRSITGSPTLSLSSWFGIPGNFKLLRNSVGYICSMPLLVDALHTLSELWIFDDQCCNLVCSWQAHALKAGNNAGIKRCFSITASCCAYSVLYLILSVVDV